MCDGKQIGLLTTHPHHTTLKGCLNAAPQCNDVCDVVMVGNTEMYECRLLNKLKVSGNATFNP